MALEDAICLGDMANECDGDFVARIPALSGDPHRAHRTRADFSLMMTSINHAKGVERLVRNSLFEGRTAEECTTGWPGSTPRHLLWNEFRRFDSRLTAK